MSQSGTSTPGGRGVGGALGADAMNTGGGCNFFGGGFTPGCVACGAGGRGTSIFGFGWFGAGPRGSCGCGASSGTAKCVAACDSPGGSLRGSICALAATAVSDELAETEEPTHPAPTHPHTPTNPLPPTPPLAGAAGGAGSPCRGTSLFSVRPASKRLRSHEGNSPSGP